METLLIANEDKVRWSLGNPVFSLLTSLALLVSLVSNILGMAIPTGSLIQGCVGRMAVLPGN